MTMTSFTPSQLRQMADNLRYSGTDSFSTDAEDMLEQAADDAERLEFMADYSASLRSESLHDASLRNAEPRWWIYTVFHTGIPPVDNCERFDTYQEAIDTARRTQEKKA